MIIFIDESGTHKQTGHATTTVVYITIPNSEKIDKELKKILKGLRLETFHWADHGWKVREKYLAEASKLDFTFKVAIFENPHPGNKMLDIVFNHLITEEDIRTIYIDGEKPKWYERRLKKVLRDKVYQSKNSEPLEVDLTRAFSWPMLWPDSLGITLIIPMNPMLPG